VNARPALLAIFVVVAAASACAHETAADKRAREANAAVAAGAQEARAWLNRFKPCAEPIDTTDVESLPKEEEKDPPTVAVRGLMTLESSAHCHLMRCEGGGCCNGCSIRWVLVAPQPPEGQARRELAIRKNGTWDTLGIGAMDCTVKEVRRQFPSAEVIVTGRIWKDGFDQVITPTSICRVPSPSR